MNYKIVVLEHRLLSRPIKPYFLAVKVFDSVEEAQNHIAFLENRTIAYKGPVPIKMEYCVVPADYEISYAVKEFYNWSEFTGKCKGSYGYIGCGRCQECIDLMISQDVNRARKTSLCSDYEHIDSPKSTDQPKNGIYLTINGVSHSFEMVKFAVEVCKSVRHYENINYKPGSPIEWKLNKIHAVKLIKYVPGSTLSLKECKELIDCVEEHKSDLEGIY